MAKLKKLKVQEVVKDPGDFSPDDPRSKMINTGNGTRVQNAPKELYTNPRTPSGKPLDPSTWQTPAQLEFEKRLAKK